MLPFAAFDALGLQPWLWTGPSSPWGLVELGVVGDGEALEPVGTRVAGRRALYGVGGAGPPVLFLHACGLSFRSYQRSLRRLTGQGYQVLAPSLPGFGGTAALPAPDHDLRGFARWVAQFLDGVGVQDPVLVIGHSFGAGVGVQLAHDHPERVGYLALMDSAGTSWSTPKPLQGSLGSARSLTSWMGDAWKQLLPFPDGLQTLQAVANDVVLNTLTNGWAGAQVAMLGRDADVGAQLERLRQRRLPVLRLTNDDDAIVPDRCFERLAGVMGHSSQALEQKPAWLLVDADAFDAVAHRVSDIRPPRCRPDRRSAHREVVELLGATDMPAGMAEELVRSASPLWLMSELPEALAIDLALCHPPLEAHEVRAVARPVAGSNAVRLTVVAADRPGLLADTAAVLAVEGHSVTAASACSWPDRGLALHSLTFEPGGADVGRLAPKDWEDIGQRLRALARGRGRRRIPEFRPIGPATVVADGGADADAVVEVSAPDTVGLLWAICQWFADQGVTIVSASASTNYGVAEDGFIVRGQCDGAALATHLSPPELAPEPEKARPRPAAATTPPGRVRATAVAAGHGASAPPTPPRSRRPRKAPPAHA